MKLEDKFTAQAKANAQTALLAHGAATKRLLQDLETYGGVRTAQDLCRKHRVSDGFDQLAQCRKLELSLEALVIKGQYGALFTDEEANWCLDVLMEAGFFS